MSATPRLCELPLGFRLGLTGVIASLLLGVWASLRHVQDHHEKRDERPGVSLDDLRGAYHGIENRAAFALALDRGHPDGLAAADRALLESWLAGGKLSEQYDDPDLGASAPAEVIQRACLACHARNAADGIGRSVPLEYWDDVAKVVVARRIDAVPEEVLTTSTHTHALSMALMTLAVGALAFCTRWPRRLTGALAALTGLGLACDLAGWWLARGDVAFVWFVVAGGSAWAAATVASLALALLDLWLPRPRA